MATSAPKITIVDGPHYKRGDDGWEHHAYKLRLTHQGRQMTVPWKQGIGITNDPDIGSVMSALISDASSVEYSTGFADWAESLGFNPDSIKDREVYQQAEAQTDKLSELLGRQLMVALMDDEDSTYGDDAHFLAAWTRATGKDQQ